MADERVLVTGTGHLGVGEGIVQCLRAAGRGYVILAANGDPRASSLFSCDAGYLLPHASAENYLDVLEGLCAAESVSFLIPGSEAELNALCDAHSRFARLGCTLLANARSVVEIGSDKFRTHQFLKEHGLPTPDSVRHPSVEHADRLGWPVIVKPVRGGGSRHVNIATCPEELEAVLSLMRVRGIDVFMQRCVGSMDEEYTTSALFDPSGQLIGSFAARRRLVGGATASVEVHDFPELRDLTVRVARCLRATGPINVQLRVGDQGPSIFEINPRFSGSAPFRAACGFNEPDLLIQSILAGSPVEWGPPRLDVMGLREFREVLVPQADVAQVGGAGVCR